MPEQPLDLPPPAVNPIDADFDEAETEFFPLLDRARLTRDFMEEINGKNDNFIKRGGWDVLKGGTADGKTIKHYLLPDFPGKRTEVEERYPESNNRWMIEYKKTGKRIFIQVGQCYMWETPYSPKPYFLTTTSECSTIAGFGPEGIIVAHISFSALAETEATIEFMKSRGMPIENIYAIASTGTYQETASNENVGGYGTRAKKEDYTNLGLPKENIITFDYEYKDGINKNLAHTIITPDYIFVYAADYKTVKREYGHGVYSKRLSDYYNEQILPIPPISGVK